MKISISCQFVLLAVFGVTGYVSGNGLLNRRGGDDESQYFLHKARQHYKRIEKWKRQGGVQILERHDQLYGATSDEVMAWLAVRRSAIREIVEDFEKRRTSIDEFRAHLADADEILQTGCEQYGLITAHLRLITIRKSALPRLRDVTEVRHQRGEIDDAGYAEVQAWLAAHDAEIDTALGDLKTGAISADEITVAYHELLQTMKAGMQHHGLSDEDLERLIGKSEMRPRNNDAVRITAAQAGEVRVYLTELRELFKREKYIELLAGYVWMPDIERNRWQERPDQYVAVVKSRREVILAVIPTLMGGENWFVRPDGTIHVVAGLRAVSSYREKFRKNRDSGVMPSITLKQRPDEGHWRFEANGFHYWRSRELRGLELR
jgi:hypothetical protein